MSEEDEGDCGKPCDPAHPCAVCAKRAKVRVSVHAVWLRERARRERAEEEVAILTAERDAAKSENTKLANQAILTCKAKDAEIASLRARRP